MPINPHKFSQEWEAGWNSHQLDRILSHYTEDVVFRSKKSLVLTGEGEIHGRKALKAYWAAALKKQPDLKFEVINVFEGFEMLVISYRNQHDVLAIETLYFNSDGLVFQAAACHLNESDDIEIPLEGGNINESVVRVGDTVRRSMNTASPSVHRLLKYVQSCGHNFVPEFLGIDKSGREILSYIEGKCEVSPEHWLDKRFLKSAGQLLKAYHDATANYVSQSSDEWAYEYPDISQHEVICHNDFAPYNLVSSNNEFVAIIDFDLAGPGPRLRDIAYAAYWLVPLSPSDDRRMATEDDIKNGCRRLKLFCRECGVVADTRLLDMVSEVLHRMANEQEVIDSVGIKAAVKLKIEGHLDHWASEAAGFDELRALIEQQLE